MSIRRWIRNLLAGNESRLIEAVPSRPKHNEGSLHFNISPATGGYVMDFGYYESKTDRHYNRLYVIHDNDDLAESIAQIITIECLKR